MTSYIVARAWFTLAAFTLLVVTPLLTVSYGWGYFVGGLILTSILLVSCYRETCRVHEINKAVKQDLRAARTVEIVGTKAAIGRAWEQAERDAKVGR